MKPSFYLGLQRPLDGSKTITKLLVPAHHLVKHTVVFGMTGSGKTGLATNIVEEALRAGVPVLWIDVKGDSTNGLLAFPTFDAGALDPYVESTGDEAERRQRAEELAAERKQGLEAYGIDLPQLTRYRASTHFRVVTPGSDAGEPLHLTGSLELPSSRWQHDPEGARASLSATISLILRVLGRDADPGRSREHALLSILAEERLKAGGAADIPSLLPEIAEPSMPIIGALEVDDFMSKRARRDLAASLNTLLAAPSFASWRQGTKLDIGAWLAPVDGRTPATILSVAHLDDEERELVLGMVLEEILSHVRSLPGSQRLKALVVFDEVYGFLPPHPASPPTKRPLVALMKQARAFGVGVVIATQNPMDIDYRALSNAGLWCLGRLQTDADRERVLDGLSNAAGRGESAEELGVTLKQLRPRWFVVRDAETGGPPVLLQPRWTMSFMRGPMTRHEIRLARATLEEERREAGGRQE